MDSNPSSGGAWSGGLDLNSDAAAAVQHQEPATESGASEPAAGPLEDIAGAGGSTTETLDDPPVVSVDSGKGCLTEMGSGRGQNPEMGTASVGVIERVGDEGLKGVSNPEGIGADVEGISNEAELGGEGVSSPEKKQSKENGEVVGHDEVDGPVGLNQGVSSELTVDKGDSLEGLSSGTDQSKDSNLMSGGNEASILVPVESKITTNAPEVEAVSEDTHLVDGDGKADVIEVQVKEQEQLEGAEKDTVEHASMEPQSSAMDNDRRARYNLPPQEDNTVFSASSLVWGKVKSYPWWPGEIVDPSDASDMALKIQKGDKFLIAYFGDKTFAWNDESRLKPFYSHFYQMEKQRSLEGFANAVNAALVEVTRRVELGMTCSCFADEAYANMKYQKVENAGVREGTCCSVVDRTLIVNSFQPERLLQFIEALAQFPSGGADRLELAIAKAQLKAFYHSKGYPELPIFLVGGGLMEDDPDNSPSGRKKYGEDTGNHSTSNVAKRKLRGGEGSSSKKKHISEDGRKQKKLSELMEETDVPHLANGGENGSRRKIVPESPGKKRKVLCSASPDLDKSKKKRLDSLGDLEAKTPSRRSIMVGERIRRIANQLTGSPPIVKTSVETKASRKRGDVGAGGTSHSHAVTSRIRKGASKVYSSPSELLSQLCLAARDPMKGYSFLPEVTSFFTDFWTSLASSSSEDREHIEVVGGKRGRRRSANAKSALTPVTPDYTQDSYWSDVIFHSSPEELASSGRKRKGKSQSERRKKMKPSGEEPSPSLPSDTTLGTLEQVEVGSADPCTEQESTEEKPMSNSGEKISSEYTALILSFAESDALPSATDLISIFSCYGPLEEAKTEVLEKANCAKVVFRNRADAETAYSSAGKLYLFGSSLVSYRLSYLASTPKASPKSEMQDKINASPIEGTGVVSDHTQVEVAGN